MKCLNLVLFAVIIFCPLGFVKMSEMWPYFTLRILQNIDTPAINKIHLTRLFSAKTEIVPTYSFHRSRLMQFLPRVREYMRKISLASLI